MKNFFICMEIVGRAQKSQKIEQLKTIEKQTVIYKPTFGRKEPVENFVYYQDPESDKNTILSFDIKK